MILSGSGFRLRSVWDKLANWMTRTPRGWAHVGGDTDVVAFRGGQRVRPQNRQDGRNDLRKRRAFSLFFGRVSLLTRNP